MHIGLHNANLCSWLLLSTKTFIKTVSKQNISQQGKTIFASHINKKPTNPYSTSTTDRSVGLLSAQWERSFRENGISEPDLSIQHIMAHVLQLKSRAHLPSVQFVELKPDQVNLLKKLCNCRLARMPVQYIVGDWEFRDLTLKLHPPIFIPRPETEELVDIILSQIEDLQQPLKLMEIGCGSGAITLSLLKKLPQAECIAIDKSKAACRLTLKNAILHNLQDRIQIFNGKLLNGKLDGFKADNKIDILVSNPPYIPRQQLLALQPEVKLYEDLGALDGGLDGLAVIKNIILFAETILSDKGQIFLEVDPSHPTLLETFLVSQSKCRIKYSQSYKDFNKKDRFVKLAM